MNRRHFLQSLSVAIAAFQSFKLSTTEQLLHDQQFKQLKRATLVLNQWELSEQHAINSVFSTDGMCEGRAVYDCGVRLAHGYRIVSADYRPSVVGQIYKVDDLTQRECLPNNLAHILRDLGTDEWLHFDNYYQSVDERTIDVCDEWVYYRTHDQIS